MSMNPGARTRPFASMTRAAGASILGSTAAIQSPRTPTSPVETPPRPSWISAPRKRRSNRMLNPGHALDLDGDAAGERAGLDGRAGRVGRREHRLVDLVHRLEVLDVAEVDVDLHDLLERAARRLEDGFDVR